jgi:acetyl/propionyl-CoA carboxylase alpha subunit
MDTPQQMTAAHTLRKLLIANRGEIACRIARTCRSMGIASVAVYSDADSGALHVESADEAIHIGGAAASESYLNFTAILDAAQRSGADALHPGYGFLAETPGFAQAVIDAGLIWVGPPPSAIEAMGKKHEAKRLLVGTPFVPGYSGDDQSDEALSAAAQEIGYPVMVKASAGGGGKGMRRVDSLEEIVDALSAARHEAQHGFGDDRLILEKYVDNPRHIEIQIAGDQYGRIIALGERECSIQRRHQKIIEETPSTALTPELRRAMREAAISIGRQIGYYNVGTVEFLLDSAKNFYFMEMNTRLQVEHPVTEMVYGEDLVAWQIRIAEGYSLGEIGPVYSFPCGHAIEARIYAEDSASGFLPATGKILYWSEPVSDAQVGVRVDSGVRTGSAITVHDDPMIAKVIAHGRTRSEAIRRLDFALSQVRLLGVKNNIAFLRRVLTHPDHLAGEISTDFVNRCPELLSDDTTLPPAVLIAAALARSIPVYGGPTGAYGWRNNPYRPIRHTFTHTGTFYEVLLTPERAAENTFVAQIGAVSYHMMLLLQNGSQMEVVIDGHRQRLTVFYERDTVHAHHAGSSYILAWQQPLPAPGSSPLAAEGSLRAPMPGKVISIRVEVGQQVAKGVIVLTLEAMKMEHRIQAPHDGIVEAVHFQVGDSVQADQVLLDLSRPEERD